MGGSSEHRATWEPKAVACTLGTLNTDCGKAFSLLRFFVAVGHRNKVPPCTVPKVQRLENRDKAPLAHERGAGRVAGCSAFGFAFGTLHRWCTLLTLRLP